VQNVSFVAQAVDWIPEVLYDIISKAYHHKGLSFVRILQRCPEWLPDMFEPFMHDPMKTKLLTHEKGLKLSANISKVYKNQEQHDPSDIHKAREIASYHDPIPVGILYHNPDVPVYEELRHSGEQRSARYIKTNFEAELDKFTVWPPEADNKVRPTA
jgi:2-oxoglutarate ferredoxin oxidoreductase subunit beta